MKVTITPQEMAEAKADWERSDKGLSLERHIKQYLYWTLRDAFDKTVSDIFTYNLMGNNHGNASQSKTS